MPDFIEIKFKIEGGNINLETFSWADLREFLDRLVPALGSMTHGPSAGEVLPVRVERGSAQPVLRMPRTAKAAVYRFRAGPTRTWTGEQRLKAGRVYDFLDRRGATLSCGARKLKPLFVPTGRPDWTIREHTTLIGTVRRAGGAKGNVEVIFEGERHVHCRAGKALAKELASKLYERVRISGVAERDALTRAMVGFEIESWVPSSRQGLAVGIGQLRELLGDDMTAFDPGEHLGLLRGDG